VPHRHPHGAKEQRQQQMQHMIHRLASRYDRGIGGADLYPAALACYGHQLLVEDGGTFLRSMRSRAGRRPDLAAAVVLRSCAHRPLVSVAVKTYPRYERDEANLQNDGQSWEFFDA
jgi:hypothetical protein